MCVISSMISESRTEERKPPKNRNYKIKKNYSMANKNFAALVAAAKRVNYLVVLMVAVVFNFFMASCEDDYDAEMTRQQTQSFEGVDEPVTPLDWDFNYKVNNHGWSLETPWTLTEKTSQFSANGYAKAVCSHEYDRYAVPEDLKLENPSYAQEHTRASETYSKILSSEASLRVSQDSVRYTAEFKDGNLAYLDITTSFIKQVYLAKLDTTVYNLANIKVKNVRVKNVENLPGNTVMTRGTYVSDSIMRRVTWEVTFEVVKGDIADNMTISPATEFTQEVQDWWKVLILSEDDIERVYTKDRDRYPIDDNTEICKFTQVFVMKSGSIHESPKSIILNRELKGIPEYLKTVTSFSYTWRKDNGVVLGTVSYGVRKEGNWTVDSRIDSFSANISNDAEPIVTSYTFKHEGATYKDEWSEEVFELVTPTMAENRSYVESIVSDNADYDQARLFNFINTTYLGYAQEAGETVKLQKKAVTIKKQGWESLEGTRVIYNDSVTWTPVYRIEWTDGNVLRTPAHMSDDRLAEIFTKWLTIELNSNQSTGNIAFGTPSYKKMSVTINGFLFEWERQTREGSNIATLNGSKQDNRGRFIEPVRMKVTHIASNNSVTYDDVNVSATHTASVTGGSVVDGYHVYNYRDNWSYKYGDNTKSLVAPGTIKVLAEGIVSEGWDEASASEVWYDTKVTRSIDWVTKWNTGREERENYSCDAPRSYRVNSEWSSVEKNNTYGTSNETVTVTSSTQQSKTIKDAVFTWDKEIRSITTVVTLNESTKNNGWIAEDPMNGVVSKNGQTFRFGRKTVSTSHRDGLTLSSENRDYKNYAYGDAMSYTVGGNTKTLTAPGTISVYKEKTFFPEPWGEIVDAKQTVCNNETHDSYDYTWSLTFVDKQGVRRVLPVVVRKGATKPEWNFAYVEITNETTYNGGTYQSSTGTWVNSTAVDMPNQMSWSREGTQRANKTYASASHCNWDERHTVKGHASVNTSRYTLTIKNGVLSATDSYTGNFMGSWSSYVGD